MTLDEIKEKITAYAALVADGHETCADIQDVLLTEISWLTNEDDIEAAHDHLDAEFLSLY